MSLMLTISSPLASPVSMTLMLPKTRVLFAVFGSPGTVVAVADNV